MNIKSYEAEEDIYKIPTEENAEAAEQVFADSKSRTSKRLYEAEDLCEFPEELSVKQKNQLARYLDKTSKFAKIDFKKGYRELRKKFTNERYANEAFLAIFSNDKDTMVRSFRKCNVIPKDVAIFWSGEKALKAATYYALKKGCKIITHTPMGFLFMSWQWYNRELTADGKFWDKIDEGLSSKPLWQALSQVYSEKCKFVKKVIVFITEDKIKNENTIWNKIEEPTLRNNSIDYTLYIIPTGANPIDICNQAISES